MHSKGIFWFFAVVSLILLESMGIASGDCRSCNKVNSAACHNENTFSFCYDGVPSQHLFTCPPDYVCTGRQGICFPKDEASADCENPSQGGLCGKCDSNGIFSCINETAIAFCFGDLEPDYNNVAFCPTGFVCDLNNPGICSEEGKVKASCVKPSLTKTTPSTISTTPSIAQDANTLCRDIQKNGFYKPDADPTCKKYVYCYLAGNNWAGHNLVCSDNQYFNEVIQICVKEIPSGCLIQPLKLQ